MKKKNGFTASSAAQTTDNRNISKTIGRLIRFGQTIPGVVRQMPIAPDGLREAK